MITASEVSAKTQTKQEFRDAKLKNEDQEWTAAAKERSYKLNNQELKSAKKSSNLSGSHFINLLNFLFCFLKETELFCKNTSIPNVFSVCKVLGVGLWSQIVIFM